MPNLRLNHPCALLLSLYFDLPRRAGILGILGMTAGLTTACVVSVHDGDWDGSPEACYEHYEDCLDDAWPFGAEAIGACETLLESCLEDCGTEGDDSGSGSTGATGGSSDGDGGDSGDGGDAGDGDSEGGDPPPRADEGGDGDGDPDTGTETETDTGTSSGDGDGDGPNPECFDLHAACVAAAETIQDIEACEALFDNCIDPGPCDEPGCEEPGCPQAELDACVDVYAGCAAAAETEVEVLACAAEFDACIAQFDVSLCLPNYDDALVLECLEQHELCIACADDASEIDACKVTFDNCLEG
jgi:hypothetical protein